MADRSARDASNCGNAHQIAAYRQEFRLLDLFCGAGGCTAGYQRAGFYVVGVDTEPQPNYCGDAFVQADALEVLSEWHFGTFDAIHASPPCQAYSIAQNASKNAAAHPDLIDPVRDLLEASGLPWVIENVPGSPLRDPIKLCGKSFGLNVKRHRLFETNWPTFGTDCPQGHGYVVSVFGGGSKGPVNPETGKRTFVPIEGTREAMDIDWMTGNEMSQAIPPAYTHFLGLQLRAYIEASGLLVAQEAVS